MASVMGICGGLVGPKSENVDLSHVFIGFLKGTGGGDRHGGDKRRKERTT